MRAEAASRPQTGRRRLRNTAISREANDCASPFPQVRPLSACRRVGGGESTYTPDSVPGCPGDGHPSRLTVARPLLRPTRGSNGRAAHSLCSALLRVGFVEPPESPPALVRSYRTVSPLPVRPESRHRRSVLCGTFLRVAPTGCYPAPCPVESGRSSDGSLAGPYAAIRPTRHRSHSYRCRSDAARAGNRWPHSRQFDPSGPTTQLGPYGGRLWMHGRGDAPAYTGGSTAWHPAPS